MALSLWDASLYGSGLLLVIYFYTKYIKQTGFPLPPGPPKWPVLGNLLDFPSNAEWETYSHSLVNGALKLDLSRVRCFR